MIYNNNDTFFKTQFLNLSDVEQTKKDNNYNKEHKYIRMLEYKKIETADDIKSLINLNALIDIIIQNIDEVSEIGILEISNTKQEIKDFNIKSIHTHQQEKESLKNSDTAKLKRQFNGKGEVKGFRFNQIARNGYAVIYEKRYGNYIFSKSYEVFELKTNKRFNTESYPSSKAFGVWAWQVDTLEEAVHKLHEITKRVKERKSKNVDDDNTEL